MYYKLKVNKDSIKVVGTVEFKKENDKNYIYATEEELNLLNPAILTFDTSFLKHKS